MTKKTLDMIALSPEKANAQNMTCFMAFISTTAVAIFMMILACTLPVIVPVTEVVCWVSMVLEAAAAGLGFVAFWIRKNAL